MEPPLQISPVRSDPQAVDERRSSESRRSIPSLDGLRAISVAMVLVSHYKTFARLPRHGALHALIALAGQGSLGVTTFFVISGFLITTLLRNELDRSGGVRLGRFYFRRCFRIFPPFYVFLAGAAIVAHLQHHPVPRIAWLSSALYFANYIPYSLTHPLSSGWYVGHTWSLSVEEQFYFVWPALVAYLTRRRSLQCCAAILLAAPFLRLASAYLLPVYQFEQQYLRLFHSTMDALAVGCVAALWMRDPQQRRRIEDRLQLPLLLAAAAYLTLSTVLADALPPWYQCLFGVDLTVFSVALLMLYVVVRPASLSGRALNWTPLRHLGMISYSLYLWQQIFFSPYRLPSSVISGALALLCAELSFWLVERPTLRMRGNLEQRLFTQNVGRHAAPARTASISAARPSV